VASAALTCTNDDPLLGSRGSAPLCEAKSTRSPLRRS